MRLNVCVNRTSPFGPFASLIKGETLFDSDSSSRGLPTRRDSGPIRYECVPCWQTWFRWRFRVFFWMVCNRRQRGLLVIVGSSAVYSRGRQGEKPYVSFLRRSELSAQVRQHNSNTLYSQRYGEGVPMAPRLKLFLVRWGRWSQCLLIGCAPIGANVCISRSSAIHSRHTKPSSSPNCRQTHMWELGRRCRWN